jgi:cell wall-associated NlpC family hydrolase
MVQRGWHFLAVTVAVLVLGACASLPRNAEIRDVRTLPQKVSFYLDPATEDRPLLPPGRQSRLADAFLERYFTPWKCREPLTSKEKAFWAIDEFRGKPLYGENQRPLGSQWAELVRQSDMEDFPSLDLRGITVGNVSLRAMPTRLPAFRDPSSPGEGFPFDYFQNSALPANTPLHVVHRSRNGAWLFVETAAVFGWLPAGEVAMVDEAFVRSFSSGAYLVLTRDDVPVPAGDGSPLFVGKLGTIFPLVDGHPGDWKAWAAVMDENRHGVLKQVRLTPKEAAIFPLPLTPGALASLADGIMGRPYAWGGLYQERDCSATVRDLFIPFGLWLPRNSAKQARAGRVISLENLTPEEKEEVVGSQGVPFLTLLWMRGHVMLYLGKYRGRPLVLQNLWGIKIRHWWGGEGRQVVGRVVITTLSPGLELPDIALPEGDLRWKLKGMTLLGGESPDGGSGIPAGEQTVDPAAEEKYGG